MAPRFLRATGFLGSVVGILMEEFLQVDAGLIELAGGEELVGAGEVVGRCERKRSSHN